MHNSEDNKNCLPPNFKGKIEGLVLGFDFGLKRIGIASGQTLTGSSGPLTTLTSHQGKTDWDGITKLINEWQPKALIVGLPLRLDGTEQPFTQNARKFGQRLHGRYQKPVFFVEEQLSSFEAEQRNLKTPIDAHAAQIILQNWLEAL
ncbi:Holliday junction resolvase RuvX [Thiomicrospira microaerophila]|uniref:Holliday junction resolvase RuvX n=1 Tax=Thiomicrospira microaerophila TaxID=406020 RepID=UPI00200EC763|nr:Holliday junction resolvase RuvX [Thiomicrospira microaerophila]UQB41699.1 Holliday junction resolvase RuvX [Thiomicrospira microaerophila]